MCRRPSNWCVWTAGAVAAAVALTSACGSGNPSRLDPAARPVELPGAMAQIDFDDITYSERLERVLVPARRNGLYLIEPASGKPERVGHLRSADSADEGRGLIFVLARDERAIEVVDPAVGEVIASASTASPGDYVRYVAPERELWVTEPAASRIEIFAVPDEADPTPQRAGFVPTPNGAEGFAWSHSGMAYTHSGPDVTAIDTSARTVTAQWPTGCSGTHGFPRIDEHDEFLLASCAGDGDVVLLDLNDGSRLGRYAAGGGEALPAYSSSSDHFYARGDPGSRLVTLSASREGLQLIKAVEVPNVGHCLTADSVGHVWTCDADEGRVLRFDDP